MKELFIENGIQIHLEAKDPGLIVATAKIEIIAYASNSQPNPKRLPANSVS